MGWEQTAEAMYTWIKDRDIAASNAGASKLILITQDEYDESKKLAAPQPAMDRFEHMVAILYAGRDGKSLQLRRRGTAEKWFDLGACRENFAPDFATYEYRIKQVAREWWIVPGRIGERPAAIAEYQAGAVTHPHAIHVREVLDE